MSSILDALKKAQKEELEKKEKKGDRVVWMVPQKRKFSFPRWGAVALLLAALGALAWAGVLSLQKTRLEPAHKAAATQKARALSSLKLEGILWDEKQPFALVNSQMVKKGDVVGGLVVTNISPTQVELSSDGAPQVLSLEKE